MAGHSKWANIKHKKAKEDVKKGKVFTKLVREITVACREGGGDPASNLRLRLFLEKAKLANMPSDNITRAIKKGTGELEGQAYESVTYEGYGPHGVAVMVEALTDNKNRTASEVRHAFSKGGGNLGGDGSVSWMFVRRGVVTLHPSAKSEDELLEIFLEHAIDSIDTDEQQIRIVGEPSELYAIKATADSAGLVTDTVQLEWIPKTMAAALEGEAEEKVFQFLERLDELDDVRHVFANIE
jgi:YebC/PmpR family DNA-binding regulatory protein